jgi:hypothetical protein
MLTSKSSMFSQSIDSAEGPDMARPNVASDVIDMWRMFPPKEIMERFLETMSLGFSEIGCM